MTQHPKLGVKPDALSVVRCRDYHGHYYIEGAPFRISFWTYGADIDADEAQRRLDFANELVAAWNAREAAEAASKAREAALVEALTMFVECARYQPHMGGNHSFMGWNQSGLRRAESHARFTLAALTKEPDA